MPLPTGSTRCYSHQIMAPGGVNLAWATTTPTVSLLMWPITATAGPIAAFNLSLILAPPASAWATFILARRLTGKFWPALFAGFVFGFCAYEISHEASGQPNLTVTLLIPLIAYLVLRWWDGSLSRRGFLIWMALALAAEFYTFLEAFADLTLIAPHRPGHRLRGRGAGHAAQGGPAGRGLRDRLRREHRARGAVPVRTRWSTSPSRSTRRCRSSGWTWRAWSCRGPTGCSG